MGHLGDGGPATSAELASASDVAVDGQGDVLIADPNSSRVRLVAGTDCASGCPLGLASMTKGDIYTVAGSVFGASSGDGGPAIDATMTPSGVGLDGQGDLLIADTVTVRLVAGRDCSAGCPYGLTSMTEGDVYTVAGSFFEGHSGDGGRATSAELQGPGDLKVDANGDLLIADSECRTTGCRVLLLDPVPIRTDIDDRELHLHGRRDRGPRILRRRRAG